MGTFKNPDVWKQNLAYQIGDFALYNGVVYMAIKPVPAGTAMSADYWTDFSGGGGGSSDFTTAHVTATGTNFNISDGIFNVCTCVEDGGISSTYPTSVGSGHSIEFDVILYKGTAALMTDPDNITATSGAIQQGGEGVYLITGDCSITTV